jgi:hypothetical protein
MRQHTSAYVSIRQHTPAGRRHLPGVGGVGYLVCIRQHTLAYVSIRQQAEDTCLALGEWAIWCAYISKRHRRHLPGVGRMGYLVVLEVFQSASRDKARQDLPQLRQYSYFCTSKAQVYSYVCTSKARKLCTINCCLSMLAPVTSVRAFCASSVDTCECQPTSAYVSIRQHTSAYVMLAPVI